MEGWQEQLLPNAHCKSNARQALCSVTSATGDIQNYFWTGTQEDGTAASQAARSHSAQVVPASLSKHHAVEEDSPFGTPLGPAWTQLWDGTNTLGGSVKAEAPLLTQGEGRAAYHEAREDQATRWYLSGGSGEHQLFRNPQTNPCA